MGVITKNEQYVEEIVEILEAIHDYVPEMTNPDGKNTLLPMVIGGDQLTVARSRSAKQVRVTGESASQAL